MRPTSGDSLLIASSSLSTLVFSPKRKTKESQKLSNKAVGLDDFCDPLRLKMFNYSVTSSTILHLSSFLLFSSSAVFVKRPPFELFKHHPVIRLT